MISENPGVIRVQTAEELGVISISVTDNGNGMDPKEREAASGAFWSTKEGHRGIGLNAAEYIAKKHGGRLQINSMPGRGTVVRLQLSADGEALPLE